ncbi:MAG: FkbM family methyltransferase [Cyanobium sp.]
MPIVAGFTFLAAALLFLALITRKRFRRLWDEFLSLRRELQGTQKELVSVRKNLLLLSLTSPLRLPARLPSEDGEEIFLYNFFNRKRSGFYVEIGAFNGVELSNTYFFEAIGWDGILIEPDPSLYRQCLLSRPNSKVINAAASDREGSLQFTCATGREWLSFSGEDKAREERIIANGGTINKLQVPCLTLNEILKDVHGEIDFVSLDVEGHELSVLKGFDLDRFRPRVIVIEQNDLDTDSPVSNLLRHHGYRKKLHLGSNSFYVHQDDQGTFSW